MKQNKELNIVRPDAKRRIVIDSIPEDVSSYKITVKDHGTIILEAYKEIPFKEISEKHKKQANDIQQ